MLDCDFLKDLKMPFSGCLLPALTGHGVSSKFSSVINPLFQQRIGGTFLLNFEELGDL